jgi:hypothetical protein
MSLSGTPSAPRSGPASSSEPWSSLMRHTSGDSGGAIVQHPGRSARCLVLSAQCSALSAQCSVLNVQCSTFSVRPSESFAAAATEARKGVCYSARTHVVGAGDDQYRDPASACGPCFGTGGAAGSLLSRGSDTFEWDSRSAWSGDGQLRDHHLRLQGQYTHRYSTMSPTLTFLDELTTPPSVVVGCDVVTSWRRHTSILLKLSEDRFPPAPFNWTTWCQRSLTYVG